VVKDFNDSRARNNNGSCGDNNRAGSKYVWISLRLAQKHG